MTAPTVSYPFAEWLITMSRLRGPVFFGWLGWPYAYLIGSEANEFVFAHDSHFRQREAFKGLIPVDGPTSVVVSDGEHHTRRRALVRPGLHHRKRRSTDSCTPRSRDCATRTPRLRARCWRLSCTAGTAAGRACRTKRSATRW